MSQTSVSRRRTRHCLFQALYSRVHLGDSFSFDLFFDSFYSEGTDFLDKKYFHPMFDLVIEHESAMSAIIQHFAPRFDIVMMPVVNVLPMLIGLCEMLYYKEDEIPVKVSINEAIELMKVFSDDSARMLVNGVMHAAKESDKSVLLAITPTRELPQYFS